MWKEQGTDTPKIDRTETRPAITSPANLSPNSRNTPTPDGKVAGGEYPVLEKAVATLDEMLEAELAFEAESQPVADPEAASRATILAAFENTLKTETVVEEVNSICEELIDESDRNPIPMPVAANWPDVPPISRFGNGEQIVAAGYFERLFKIPSRRLMATTGISLMFLTVASFAYLDPEAALDFVVKVVPEAEKPTGTASNRLSLDSGSKEILVASSARFRLPEEKPKQLADAKVVRQAVETVRSRRNNVSIIEKSPELPTELDAPQQIAALVARAARAGTLSNSGASRSEALVREANSIKMAYAPASGSQSGIINKFLGDDDFARKTLKRIKPAALQSASLGTTSPIKRSSPLIRKSLKRDGRRDKTVVRQAMLNAKGIDTLSLSQQNALTPKLVNGECVAIALRDIAGRVSPILMRDLLTSLDSNC